MSKNRFVKKKDKRKADRIPIITATIAAIAVVVGAMINILPNLLRITSDQETQKPPGTLIEYIKYDDPLGMYSVSLPSNLAVVERENYGSYVITLFVPGGYSSKSEINFDTIDVFSLIMVAVQNSSVTTEDVERFNEQMLTGVVQQNSPGVGNLIFNKKTSKGFFMKYKTVDSKSSRFTYIFGEWDNNTFAVVTFSVLGSKDTVYEDFISYATSDFVWYPSKMVEYLKP